MPSRNVLFDTASTTGLELPGPVFESQPVLVYPKYVTDQAADGTRYVYKVSNTTLYQWQLTFRHLTTGQKEDLEDFFEERGGPATTFTYQHTDGNSYTVRFVQEALPWVRNGTQWEVVIVLETADEIA